MESVRRRVLDSLAYPLFVIWFALLIGATLLTVCAPAARTMCNSIRVQGGEVPLVYAGFAACADHSAEVWGVALACGILLLVLRSWVANQVGKGGVRGAGLPGVSRPLREAFLFLVLGTLAVRSVPLREVTRLVPGLARGLDPASFTEGAGIAGPLASSGRIDPAEQLCLESAQGAGGHELGRELTTLAEARMSRFERKARRFATALGIALQVAVGLALLVLGVGLLPSTGWLR